MLPLAAQTDATRGENRSLNAAVVQSFQLPAQIDDICFMDGKLHVSTDGMLFAVSVNDGRLGFPEIDTALTSVDQHLTYAVRHPQTGTLYYTKKDNKGNIFLYEQYEKKPGRYDTRRVKPYGFSFSIEHPVFSSDGRVMVFASNCPIGFGGLDLWYSEMKDGEWQYPQNLGHRINSNGEEKMPVIYGDFLIFASNGREDCFGGYDLYASRLVALEQTGDTVTMYPIGRSQVQSLEAPFCSPNDDLGFTVDGPNGGWWVSRDSDGNEEFYSFSGRMDCIKVIGVVSDINGNLVAGAKVTMADKGKPVATVTTDGEGRYCLFVQPDREYGLECTAADHFVHRQQLVLERDKESLLYSVEKNNITLLAYTIDSSYSYGDLFGSSVSCELSPDGRRRMDEMACFLLENNNLKLRIASAYRQSADLPFCTLLNNSRLRALTEYLVGKGVPLLSLMTSTEKPADADDYVDDDAMLSAAAVSSLTVFFTFVRSGQTSQD